MRVAFTLVSTSLFTIAALGACDIASDVADAINIPIEFEHTTSLDIDIGNTTGAAAGQPSPGDAQYPVEVGAVPVDLLSQSSDLAANKEKIRRLEFTVIRVAPKTNTLTSPSPPMDLYIGPKGAKTTGESIRVATIPSIPAGSTATVQAPIDAAAMDAAQPHLLSFDFVMIPAGTLSVKKGETVPGGKLDFDLTLGIKAIINPTK